MRERVAGRPTRRRRRSPNRRTARMRPPPPPRRARRPATAMHRREPPRGRPCRTRPADKRRPGRPTGRSPHQMDSDPAGGAVSWCLQLPLTPGSDKSAPRAFQWSRRVGRRPARIIPTYVPIPDIALLGSGRRIRFVRHFRPEMAYVDAPGWASADSEPRFVAVWSGTVVCPASGCGSRWPRARMVFVRSDPNRTSGLAGPSPFPGFSDPVSRPFAPTPFVRPCRPTSPSASFPLSPLRRPWEPGRPPFSCSAPRPAAPSCWRAPPRPASSPCGPASRPATDPRSGRSASPSGRPTWLR